MMLFDLIRGPIAVIITVLIGYGMIRTVIWITQRHDD